MHVGWKVGNGKGGDAADPCRMLHLLWREEGGPAVTAPLHQGFGSKLIQFSARSDLGGKAELDFAPQGLQARIEARLA